MQKRTGLTLVLVLVIMVVAITGTGCQTAELESTEQLVLEGEGIYIGQIDSQSVEIEVDGQLKAFGLGTGVSVNGLEDGSAVRFSYVEEDARPVLLAIEPLEVIEPVLEGEGVYTGQIDSHSVEIDINGQYTAFGLGEGVSVEEIKDGSRVAFTYREDDQRPVLLSIDVLEEPVGGGNGDLVGEGVLVGQIDAQSVEIDINRAFIVEDEISVDDIEDGSLVAFAYTETGQRAVLDSIRAVDEPLEGDLAHGILIGQIDSQSVEIQYFKAFAIGEGVFVEGIADGSEVVFTYREGDLRPVLTSISVK